MAQIRFKSNIGALCLLLGLTLWEGLSHAQANTDLSGSGERTATISRAIPDNIYIDHIVIKPQEEKSLLSEEDRERFSYKILRDAQDQFMSWLRWQVLFLVFLQ